VISPALRLPRWRQALRAARVLIHVMQGLYITTFLFPRGDRARRRQLTQDWCKRLVALMHVTMDVRGTLSTGTDGGNICYVSNHVSWMDIFVLNAVSPAQFIAKSELAHWPVVGKLIRDTSTIFVERARKVDTLRVNADATKVLTEGGRLVLFPEGTTSDGKGVLKFHGSLLQPIIDAGGPLQAIALRYCDPDGSTSDCVEYVGDTTFAQSYWRVCGARQLAVEVTLFPPVPAAHSTRRQLAADAEASIRSAVVPGAAAMAPGTPSGPQAGSP
jgi:1-acyl-sn-glycerol-3-phosphate acyltransferase